MTDPPTLRRAAPPAGSAGRPPARVRAETASPSVPPRRLLWAQEDLRRLRAAATTEPGRLRIIAAVLAALLAAFGASSAWQLSDRANAAEAVRNHSQPLGDAAEIYRSLADANTTAASGFLAGGDESASVRERYDQAIRRAAHRITRAAATSEAAGSPRPELAFLNEQLPIYTGLVETARANNRQGLPVGGAYLRYADDRMRNELLPAARELYIAETAQVGEDYGHAKAWPWIALAFGGLTLAALVQAQRRHYQHTNRVFSPGLLVATAATTVALLWMTAGHLMARESLTDSERYGAQSLRVLNDAWIGSLQARSDESLTLVARGAGTEYEEEYQDGMARLAGRSRERAGGLLARALELADNEQGRAPVRSAIRNTADWRTRHREVRAQDDAGDYEGAVRMVIGPRPQGTTGDSFDEVDEHLGLAMRHERLEFEREADAGRRAFSGLPGGAGALALLGAVGVLIAVGRRLSEYR